MMLKIRSMLILLGMLLSSAASADVQVNIGIGLPHANIGIYLPAYPQLVIVPGYPVYYAPRLDANFFFYDGMYWVYQDDDWYASSWYNGPWWLVQPEAVPVFILRIPVRYYRQPPAYFRGWRPDAPPHWGDHWGHDWEQRRGGWDRWNHRATPAPAPLPAYQRQYSGDRYPERMEQQHELQQRNYHYQPRDPIVRKSYQEQAVQRAPVQHGKPQQEKQGAPEQRGSRQPDFQRSAPQQQDMPGSPRLQSPQRGHEDIQRPIPAPSQQRRPEGRDHRQPPQPDMTPHEQPMQRSQGREEKQHGKDAPHEQHRGQGQGQDQGRNRNE